ncbi:uncharacterized protein BDZ99DRAFT_470955 [Mytilinidion resinicola]|uniref:Uncharacterized protein n=1 Tax=Mytilinidion resinicola TaxID=574789 RepID=A0A6A6Z4C7_9PEZI|nr:uncharacterized protein BDZ99DRAFT_470955 [Mytilinidion resinicola]KAF2815589.1 hypothetical protein BDZ99DRAFT_470955 [Mytilinidion resinicola]
MNSLQSYGKGEPVSDNNAYTITSIYHNGQLQMYTSHPTQPSTPGGRPEYHMTQLNTWGMTGNPETFRQGAGAFRNARDWAKEQRDKAIEQANERAMDQTQPEQPEGRSEYHMTQLRSFAMTDTAETFRQGAGAYRNLRDWAKEQRDEAIRQANERADPVEAEAPAPTGDLAGDASGASPASSFVTAVSDTEAYTTSGVFQTSPNGDSNTWGDFEESDSSTEELDYRPPAKRSSRRSKPPQTEPKRRNAGESTDGSHSHGPVSQSSPANVATTQQREEWSWTDGKFQCRKGQTLVKEQSDAPADVWVYYDQGWPGQGEKKWRHWMSATREILYS